MTRCYWRSVFDCKSYYSDPNPKDRTSHYYLSRCDCKCYRYDSNLRGKTKCYQP